jgi:hypothetical protein
MTLEVWLALGAAGLLAVAALVQGVAFWRGWASGNLVAAGVRVAAAVALAVALVLAAGAHGQWSPIDLRQVVLGLALAALLVQLVLAWRIRSPGVSLVVDLVALSLILVGTLAVGPGGPPLNCIQRAVPFQVQWVLLIVGAAAALVAGSTGLALALYLWLSRRRGLFPFVRRSDLYVSLKEATRLALVTLWGGLAVGAWWAWQALGALSSGDAREGWMAIACLVAAASLLAWRLERRAARWAAVLAVAAAAAALFGLLAVNDLRMLWGL